MENEWDYKGDENTMKVFKKLSEMGINNFLTPIFTVMDNDGFNVLEWLSVGESVILSIIPYGGEPWDDDGNTIFLHHIKHKPPGLNDFEDVTYFTKIEEMNKEFCEILITCLSNKFLKYICKKESIAS
jgi:hypothetical protein